MENSEKISELAAEAKELENEGAKFMDPGAKRRGRPKGSSKKTVKAESTPENTPDNTPPMPPTTEIVRPVITLMSGWTSRMVKDERAKMLPEEAETITICTAALIDKYAMSLGKYAVEIAFAATLGAYTLRVIAINETNKEDRAKKEREPFEHVPVPNPGSPGHSSGDTRNGVEKREFYSPLHGKEVSITRVPEPFP